MISRNIQFKFKRKVEQILLDGFVTEFGQITDKGIDLINEKKLGKIPKGWAYSVKRTILELPSEKSFYTRLVRDPSESAIRRMFRNENTGFIQDFDFNVYPFEEGDTIWINIIFVEDDLAEITLTLEETPQ